MTMGFYDELIAGNYVYHSKKKNHKKIVIDLKYKLYAQIWAEKNENIHMRLKCIYLNRYSFVENTEKFLLSI